eukprot:6179120-Pleurochrysis_carterae.AAC.2
MTGKLSLEPRTHLRQGLRRNWRRAFQIQDSWRVDLRLLSHATLQADVPCAHIPALCESEGGADRGRTAGPKLENVEVGWVTSTALLHSPVTPFRDALHRRNVSGSARSWALAGRDSDVVFEKIELGIASTDLHASFVECDGKIRGACSICPRLKGTLEERLKFSHEVGQKLEKFDLQVQVRSQFIFLEQWQRSVGPPSSERLASCAVRLRLGCWCVVVLFRAP